MLAALVVGVILAGCARLPQSSKSEYLPENGALGQCAAFFAALDQQTAAAKVRDAGSFRVPGYPYLRVNRFLASFRTEAQDGAEFAAWLQRMQRLDQRARAMEISNLPEFFTVQGSEDLSRAELGQRVLTCGEILKTADFRQSEARVALRNKVFVPDEYLTARRFLGLYPVSRLFLSRGITAWQKEVRKQYNVLPPEHWNSISYHAKAPRPGFAVISRVMERTRRDALGIPRYSDASRLALFRSYAPAWQIETTAAYDQPGVPIWLAGGGLDLDNTRPVVYTQLSFTRFAEQILTQLNYVIWFSARPMESDWDMYGGVLDGLTFRITLDEQGVPLVYESMHNCGCYYRVYPSHRLQARKAFSAPEPPLILASPEVDWQVGVIKLALNSRTHYVQHLFSDGQADASLAKPYTLAEYSTLLSLPTTRHQRRSLFSEDGTVSASRRLERLVLWPSGIYSPGAMRQLGRHAIAFIGRRHFDDPYLLERMFIRN